MGSGRYDGVDTYGGPTPPSETAKRYRENDMGSGGSYGSIPDKMPSNQSVGSIEKSLPDESLSSLTGQANSAAKKSGSDSELA